MKIAFISPGSGGSFYCQNCFRDEDFLRALADEGNEVYKVPMYLPVKSDGDPRIFETPVFFGAINVYLKDRFPSFRYLPSWVNRMFNAPPLLNLAAKKSGSTSPVGLEEMTVSMLRGEEGRQASELDELIVYLKTEIRPDVVHLSNALLLGLAGRLKKDLGARLVCSLQDENEWVDLMTEEYQRKVWGLMAEKAAAVDAFVAVSKCFAANSRRRLNLAEDKVHVFYGGLNLDGYDVSALPFDPPVLGYLCRMSEFFGLGILIDAFLLLKKDERFKNLRLHLTGGYSGDDKKFVRGLLDRIAGEGWGADVQVFPHFDKANRVKFLAGLTLLSVPVPTGEAFGAYQVEAAAAGVPAVQPNVGCFPEFVEVTGAGLIYQPNVASTLAENIAKLLSDPDRVREMGARGRKVVMEQFPMNLMVKNMVKVYESLA